MSCVFETEQLGKLLEALENAIRANRRFQRVAAIGEEVEKPVKQIIPDWLNEFADVFQEPEGANDCLGVQHKITLREGARSYRKVPYRLGEAEQKLLQEKIEEFLARGWIRPSQSEWATVAIVVPKKDEPGRVCIDYRDLNAITAMMLTHCRGSTSCCRDWQVFRGIAK